MKLILILSIILALFAISIMHAEAKDSAALNRLPSGIDYNFPGFTFYPHLIECAKILVASQIIPHTAFYSLDLKPFSQLEGIPGLEEMSCGSASAASIIDYLNRTRFPGLTDGYTNASLIANLSVYMGTTITGTKVDEELFGVMKFLQNHSIMDKFTFKFYFKDYAKGSRNKPFPPGSYNITKKMQPKSPGDFIWVNEKPNYQNIFDEFVNDHELILMSYNISYPSLNKSFGHSLALDNIDKEKNSNGNYNVSFMDPYETKIIYGEISQNGTAYFPFENSIATPLGMSVISQK